MFFGVYDGHGGSSVAEVCQDRIHKYVLSHYRQRGVQPLSRDEKLIKSHIAAFEQCDREILEISDRKGWETIGSTAMTVTIHGNPLQGTREN
jgi:serine/threonine protein phosphatase PrpC